MRWDRAVRLCSVGLLLLLLLCLQAAPSAALTVVPSNITATSATLTIAGATGSPDGFIITAVPAASNSSSSSSSSSSAFTVTWLTPASSPAPTIGSLHPLTLYSILVAPHYSSGFGASAPATAQLTTLASAPSIVAFYALPADNATDTAYGSFTLVFSVATNMQSVPASALQLTGTSTFTTRWSSSTTLLLIRSSTAGIWPAPGGGATVTVLPSAGITASRGSELVTAVSPPLTGFTSVVPGGQRAISFQPGGVSVLPAAVAVAGQQPVQLSFVSYTTPPEQSGKPAMITISVSPTQATVNCSGNTGSSCSISGSANLSSQLAAVQVTPASAADMFILVSIACAYGGAAFESDYFVLDVTTPLAPPSISSPVSLGNGTLPVQYNQPYKFSPTQYFALSSPAVSSGSLGSAPDALLSLSVSNGGLLSLSADASIVCLPACSASSSSFLLLGPVVALNSAMSSLSLTSVFPSTSTSPYLSIALDDLGNGDPAQSNTVVSLLTPVAIYCPQQQFYAVPVSAALSANLNSIQVRLNAAVDPSFTASPYLNCSQFLSSSSLPVFSHALCHFASPAVFVVVFGFDSTWQLGQSLGFQQYAFGLCANPAGGSAFGGVDVVLTVTAPAAAQQPLMTVVGPSSVPYCSDCPSDLIYITAVPESNIARLPAFLWSVEPSAAFDSQLVNLTAQQLVIPISAFTSQSRGSFVTFSLAVGYLGSTVSSAAAASHSVFVTDSSSEQLILVPYNADNLTILQSQPLSLGASVSFSSITSLAVAQTPVTFLWTAVPSLPAAAAGVNSPNLYLQPFLLSPNTNYSFTLRASQSSNGSSAQQGSVTFVVSVIGGDLYAVINGGDTRYLPVTSPLFLDGSLSYDTQAAGAAFAPQNYAYTWQCSAQAGGGCFDRLSGAVFPQGQSAQSLTLPAGALLPGEYVFSLTFTQTASAGSRTSTAAITVVVVGSQQPQVVVSSVPVSPVLPAYSSLAYQAGDTDISNLQLPAGGRVINSDYQLVLFGAVVSRQAAQPAAFSYQWSISGPSLPPSGILGASSPMLVVNALNAEQYFTPGYNYTFTLQVALTAGAASSLVGQASVTYYINRPPLCDSFAISPAAGVAFSDLSSPFFYSFVPFDPDETRALALMTYQLYRLDLASSLSVDLTGEVGQTRGSIGALTTGDPSNGFQLTVGVRAWDRYRAVSETPMAVVSAPAAGGVNMSVLQAYYVAVDSVSRDDSLTLMVATGNIFSALSSGYVDTIATQSGLPNFAAFYTAYAPLKKYMLRRVLGNYANIRAAVLVDFLAVALSDYSTLDQVSVSAALSMLELLMTEEGGEELWNDVQGDPSVLESVVYCIQQSFHASALAWANLSSTSVPSTPPSGTLPAALADVRDSITAAELFTQTTDVLDLLLTHLTAQILLPGDVLGLNYNRSLSGIIAKVQPQPGVNDFVTFPATYFQSSASISSSALQLSNSSAELVVTLLQVDGWGDRISFDIFPTVFLNIQQAGNDLPFYAAGAVNFTIGYDPRACYDGWVNAGRFRFSAGSTPAPCFLSCAVYDQASNSFVNGTAGPVNGSALLVQTLAWDVQNDLITCAVSGPGFYTILKTNVQELPPNSSLPEGIVSVQTTLTGLLPAEQSNLTQQALADIAYLLDIPPARVGSLSAQMDASDPSGETFSVFFSILGATTPSPQASSQLYATLSQMTILDTSHTERLRFMVMAATECLLGCSGSGSTGGMSEMEIIAIAVVVGFFGTLIFGVLLGLCCRQLKYWWDRHDFSPASLDEDTEMTGGAQYGGVMSGKEASEESKRRRSTRVSWYNKDVENAAGYEYSRRSRSQSDSGKQAAFRIRSDSRGSEDDGLQLDDVQVVGGEDADVSVDELAEIGIVLDEAADGQENSYVMDGKKVKAVKQLQEVDAEDMGVDDSGMGGGRSRSAGSREFSRSDSGRESSANSRSGRASLSEAEAGPASIQYQAEPSQSREERDRPDPTTPRTPGGGKRQFFYSAK